MYILQKKWIVSKSSLSKKTTTKSISKCSLKFWNCNKPKFIKCWRLDCRGYWLSPHWPEQVYWGHQEANKLSIPMPGGAN